MAWNYTGQNSDPRRQPTSWRPGWPVEIHRSQSQKSAGQPWRWLPGSRFRPISGSHLRVGWAAQAMLHQAWLFLQRHPLKAPLPDWQDFLNRILSAEQFAPEDLS